MKKLLLVISILLLVLTLSSCARLRCDHVWDAGTLIKADACGEGVKARYTCTLCGERMKGDASTHYFVADSETPASCEGLGYTHYSCARCDEEPYIANFTDAIGHNYSDPILVSESTYKSTYKKCPYYKKYRGKLSREAQLFIKKVDGTLKIKSEHPCYKNGDEDYCEIFKGKPKCDYSERGVKCDNK